MGALLVELLRVRSRLAAFGDGLGPLVARKRGATAVLTALRQSLQHVQAARQSGGPGTSKALAETERFLAAASSGFWERHVRHVESSWPPSLREAALELRRLLQQEAARPL